MGLIVGVVTGVLTTIFADSIRRFLDRPSLVLSFQPDEYCLRESNANLPDGLRVFAEHEAKYLRFKVANERGTTARACRALIVELSRRSDDGAWQKLLVDTLPLRCAYLGFDPIEIPKGAHFYFDVVTAQDGDKYFKLQSHVSPFILQGATDTKTLYRFDIAVVGENCDRKMIRLCLDWKQHWNFVDVWEENRG